MSLTDIAWAEQKRDHIPDKISSLQFLWRPKLEGMEFPKRGNRLGVDIVL